MPSKRPPSRPAVENRWPESCSVLTVTLVSNSGLLPVPVTAPALNNFGLAPRAHRLLALRPSRCAADLLTIALGLVMLLLLT